MNALHYGEQASVTTAYNQAKLDLEAHLEAVPHVTGCREFGLGFAVDRYILSGAFEHFLEKGEGPRRRDLGQSFDDEEYMGGMMGLCQELAHYAMVGSAGGKIT